MFDLRYYQQESVNAVYAYLQAKPDTNPCAVLPTGAGKSIVIAKIVSDAVTLWGGRVAILAHVKELLEQNAAKIAALCPEIQIGMYSAGLGRRDTENQVVVAGIQSVYNKADELGKFDLILVDECFTGDTTIDTPVGKKSIANLFPGDWVFTADGIAQIGAVSIRQAKKLVTMRLSNGQIIKCTENHPFFTESGWCKAGKLERGTHLFSREDVRMLRENFSSVHDGEKQDERIGMEKAAFLFHSLFENQRKSDDFRIGENKNESEHDGTNAADSRRERNVSRIASGVCGLASGRMDHGISGNYNTATAAGTRAERLQDRLCLSGYDDRNRAGRKFASVHEATGAGQAEIISSCAIRVEDISVIECDCPEFVYNLQIDGHPTYYAAETLVHNCHLIPPDGDGMYQTFLQAEKTINPNVRLIGMTATPYRLKGGLICKQDHLLNEICYEIGVRELIMRGYLSKLRGKNGKTKADFTDLHIRAGEFVADEVAAKMDNDRLVMAACSEIVSMTADRKKVLIFASSVAHAEHIKAQIEARGGTECGLVIGDTPKLERAEILDRFKGIPVAADLFGNLKPELKYLVNVGVLTTGFDAPNIDTVVLLRPTNSAGLYYQMVGRGFRLSPDTGKTDCMILDYGGNIMRHGPVDCIRVEEAAGGKKKGPPPMRECPQCQAVFPAGRTKCPDCGFEIPREEGKLHHGAHAASDGILSDQISETEFEVKHTQYSKHFKRYAGPDAPATLRVEYEIGFNDWISDWICPEHSGYARKKSERWWKERAGFELPETVDECLIYANAGKLKEPRAITVKKTPGSDWPTITKYDLRSAEPTAAAYAEDAEQYPPEAHANTEAELLQYATDRAAQVRAEATAGETWIDLDADPADIEERLAIMEADSGDHHSNSPEDLGVHKGGFDRAKYEKELEENDIPF